ncbi:PREDICTED: ras association domain-containing protein 3 isoform X2 [Cyprinodon variegatus]|uniref:ras association domain-containing protein 3 isoform X2 n=1 Tax=Cyprinodon variegatus TaxID=28743 RepID=UPI0007427A20|nr:PREDICTED: ras association domain-containing protein 3 isoform X2 [Cyprinodon variegatus]
MIFWIRLPVDGNYQPEANRSQQGLVLMGFVEYVGRRLERMSRFFCRFPEAVRRSGRLEVGPIWRKSGCKYACHAECRESVSLDCHPAASPLSQDQLNNNTPLHDVEKERWGRTELSREEIQQRIHHYNSMTKDYLKMTLNPTGVYTGFIKVVLDLRRPVTVRGGQRGAGGEAVMQEAFYLPQEVSNTLHISSENTVKQVIMALLNKFTVADNPAKYALYKRYRREEQVYVCKLADGEKPLFLRLVAGPNLDVLSFVLREQQTGEVMWDAFSIPELQNFLRILDKEEQEQRDAVIRRYEAYRQRLQEAIMEVRGPS